MRASAQREESDAEFGEEHATTASKSSAEQKDTSSISDEDGEVDALEV